MGPVARESRGEINEYIRYGYIPLDISNTGTPVALAYAYNDYSLAIMAKELGFQDDYVMFHNRSQFYKNIWEPTHQMMCPKYLNGTWKCPDFPAYPFHENYVEGNVWHYNWDVPHDLAGLVSLYPSKDSFVRQLEMIFINGTLTNDLIFQSGLLPNPYYWQGNEHNLLFPWVFHAADRPDLTQYWTRWIMDNRYNERPSGLPGNDDYGTMSAWYTFGSLGFYPLTGENWYFVGSPVFDNAVLTVQTPTGSSTIKILTYNNSPENVYVERVTLNGQPLPTPYITHTQLLQNPLLEFWMTSVRVNAWNSQ